MAVFRIKGTPEVFRGQDTFGSETWAQDYVVFRHEKWYLSIIVCGEQIDLEDEVTGAAHPADDLVLAWESDGHVDMVSCHSTQAGAHDYLE